MKQYCRYCAWCSYGDAVYCDVYGKTMSEQSAKRVNKCSHFKFNSADVFDPERIYRPRGVNGVSADQLTIDEFEEWGNA